LVLELLLQLVCMMVTGSCVNKSFVIFCDESFLECRVQQRGLIMLNCVIAMLG
jgi:hypothetical protein